MGKCVFNRKWLSDAKFSWVKEFKGDKHEAMCCVSHKVIDIERMGESALKSHMKGEKHEEHLCNLEFNSVSADVYIFTQRSEFKL